MVDRSAPQALPKAPDQFQRQNEQEMRDIVGQALDQTLRRVQALQAALDQIEEDIGAAGYLVATNNLDDLDDPSVARTNLSLVPGTHVQTQSAILSDLAGLTQAADRLPYFDSTTTAALAVFTAAGRSMVGAADAAAQTALLNAFTTSLKGLVPSGGSATTFLRGDATFQSVINSVVVQSFTSTGANTYTPTSGMKFALCFLTAGGGGGGGADGSDATSAVAAGGGAAGATVIGLFSAAAIGASKTITIGTGGTAGADTGTDGGAGGDSTISSGLATAVGGLGGVGAASANHTAEIGGLGAASGSSSGGLVIVGGDGLGGMLGLTGATINAISGQGGASFWGGGARGNRAQTTGAAASSAGENGRAFGSGASGGACINTTTGVAGGVGAPGVAYVIEFI